MENEKLNYKVGDQIIIVRPRKDDLLGEIKGMENYPIIDILLDDNSLNIYARELLAEGKGKLDPQIQRVIYSEDAKRIIMQEPPVPETILAKFQTMTDKLMVTDRHPIDPVIEHSIDGIGSEAGELIDAGKRIKWYGTEPDYTNLKEECGDILFYMDQLLRRIGSSFEDAMIANMVKLGKRYKGHEFTKEQAVNRNLRAERKLLEEGQPKQFSKGLYFCTKCGGALVGDGYTSVQHCENIDVSGDGFEPDAGPIMCDFKELTCEGCRLEKVCNGSSKTQRCDKYKLSDYLQHKDNDKISCGDCSEHVLHKCPGESGESGSSKLCTAFKLHIEPYPGSKPVDVAAATGESITENKSLNEIKHVLFTPQAVGWKENLAGTVKSAKTLNVPVAVTSKTILYQVKNEYPDIDVILIEK